MEYRASTGFTQNFGPAHIYDLHRPSYPPEAVSKLLTALEVDHYHGARILDLGAGTGKFTELLAARGEEYEIVAVEPRQEMRRELEKKRLRGVTVVEGNAFDIPVEEGSVDAVIASQVCTWF